MFVRGQATVDTASPGLVFLSCMRKQAEHAMVSKAGDSILRGLRFSAGFQVPAPTSLHDGL